MKNSILSKIFLISVLFMIGCDRPIRTLSPTEHGVKFRKMPLFLGGGFENAVNPPGEAVIVMPWEELYTLTSSVQEIGWGPGKKFQDYIHTRARDGNEVALAFTVRYQIIPEIETLKNTLLKVAKTDAEIENLVLSIARADIRHYMNELKTAEFIDPTARRNAVQKVSDAMQGRLHFYGVNIVWVNLDDFRFERLLEDGQPDETYQERLDEIQKLIQETERENSRIETIVAQKQQEFNEAQAKVNRITEEAKGLKDQATIRGQNYLIARENDSKALLVKGKAEADGLTERINALSGPGGKALLKMEIAKKLAEGNQKYIVLNDSVSSGNGSGDLNIKKVDTNQLLQQLGLIEGMKEEAKK